MQFGLIDGLPILISLRELSLGAYVSGSGHHND